MKPTLEHLQQRLKELDQERSQIKQQINEANAQNIAQQFRELFLKNPDYKEIWWVTEVYETYSYKSLDYIETYSRGDVYRDSDDADDYVDIELVSNLIKSFDADAIEYAFGKGILKTTREGTVLDRPQGT